MGLMRDFWQDWREGWQEGTGNRSLYRLLGIPLALLLLAWIVIGIWWSSEPDAPLQAATSTATAATAPVTGEATTRALINVTSTLLDKPGGFISNDVFPPGVLLDNMPNWEYGVLIQARDLVRAMRESFSRSQSQSTEDPDLARAEPRLNFSNNSWVLPATESEYRAAIGFVEAYLERLRDPIQSDAQFYARADNLRYWIGVIHSRLGSLSQRLSASVGRRVINTDLANDPAARQSTRAPAEIEVKTPWLEIDDVFYEARGTTWALIHFLRAAEQDFAEVLQNKNALVSLRQIVRELEATQEPVYSPFILNGSGFGMLANHSLVMASHISRASAALNDLRDLLARG